VTRTVAVLAAALVVQCGAVAYLYLPIHWPGGAPEKAAAADTLVDLSPEAIDTISVSDLFDNEVRLVRSGEHWVIPALSGLPADAGQVDAVLQGLVAGNRGWPVARSESAHRRFQVADGNYQRRLELQSGGDTVATVYLGASPGFRKVYARNRDGQAVFSVALSTFDIPAAAEHWIDPRLLQVRVPVRIDGDLFSLRLEDSQWVTGSGATPEPSELEILLVALKTLEIGGVASEDQVRDLANEEPDAIMVVESLAGTATLELVTLGDQYFVHSSEYPLFFRISEAEFRRLVDIDIGRISGETGDA